MMKRTYIETVTDKKGETISLSGWVHVRRDQGKMVFLVLRDETGTVQCVLLPNREEVLEKAHALRPEWVVSITGIVNERPDKMKRSDETNGDVEIEVTDITILNEATTPPFDVTGDTKEINENVRLKQRYIDLRTARMQENIRARARMLYFIRTYLNERSFIEIDTPILSNATQEGARDYVVPSRLWPQTFYALPQAPQQYKQLLMTSGFERYFQIAKCMRDEDTRGDRQPEFTQLDMELSFVTEEDVIEFNETLLIALVEALYPHKKITKTPFPRLTYQEAMERYGTDRPDLRTDPSDPDELAFCWIVDFPFFEPVDESDNPETAGEWTFTHNPFSAPKPAYLNALREKRDIGSIISAQYDVALNGNEIGGGSIRNHSPEALRSVLEIIGFDEETIEADFGHMLEALGSGAPPHGGIAWGFDRLLMILQEEPNIREVIAFPKTGEGKDLLMNSPAAISDERLRELGLTYRSTDNDN